MSDQALLDKFYSLDNLVTVEITMPNFEKGLAQQNSAFGWRADGIQNNGHHYEWCQADKVSISGTKWPTQKTEVTNVGIVKKSFGGSESKFKASFKFDFSKVVQSSKGTQNEALTKQVKQNGKIIKDLIGTKDLTLNNCKQDDSYVRQPLGYEIFRQVGIPSLRCNLATVIINGNNYGFFVNVEQPREPFLQRYFAGNDKGNLYETEWRFDITPDNMSTGFNQEGSPEFEGQKDLKLAIPIFDQCLRNPASTDWKKLVDLDNLTRVMAAQAMVNHWDGYPNNTFIYNNKPAVASPKAADVKLCLIPSGIDAILIENDEHPLATVKDQGVLAQLVLQDSEGKKKLGAALKDCIEKYEKNLDANKKLVAKLEDVIKASNFPHYIAKVAPDISNVRNIMDKIVPLKQAWVAQYLS